MTRQELRAYVLAHREDDEAIETLINRRNPDNPSAPLPQTDEDLRAMEEILQRKLGQNGNTTRLVAACSRAKHTFLFPVPYSIQANELYMTQMHSTVGLQSYNGALLDLGNMCCLMLGCLSI